MIGNDNRIAVQLFGPEIANMRAGFTDQIKWQFQHLVKVAIVQVTLPVHADQIPAHYGVKVGIKMGAFE